MDIENITSCSNGQKTAGFCSFLANISQLFYSRLAKRYVLKRRFACLMNLKSTLKNLRN